MDNKLKIAIVQTNLIWKDKRANLSNIEDMINGVVEPVDVFVLPELFNTAFCIDDVMLAEDNNGKTIQWMLQMAVNKQAVLCGSILWKAQQQFFNRCLWVTPNGEIKSYDKHQLFSLVGEQNYLTKGTAKTVFLHKGWKIQPFICYDLRFPAWCQNDAQADVQLYVANWPQKRIHHWKLLLQARAIENQCYVVGVNRIGADFYGNAHNGQSAAIDFTGNIIVEAKERDGIEIAEISKDELEKHRQRYPFWKDRTI